MAADVTTEEVIRLARAMTLKNAAADLAYGGAKSAILANPKMPLADKERLIRAFAQAIKNLTEYIPGPDMGMDEQSMAWIYSEIGRAIGLPAQMGGIPLDEIGATGLGLSVATEVASKYCQLHLEGARVVIQGFGSVGQHSARFLTAKGAILIAATDSGGTVYDPQGIDVEQLIAWKHEGKSVIDFPEGTKLDREQVIYIDSDIWIPAARPDVVRLDNVSCLKTKLVIQGANIPFTPEAEKICHARGILLVPDFIANAGGVICGAVEHQGGTKEDAFEAIDQKIRHNTTLVMEQVKQTGILPREAAVKLAKQRVEKAMKKFRLQKAIAPC
jgi:glutamate dehydrogenase (NAD(P)+)/glutamate dehydrogenase (NADP+)